MLFNSFSFAIFLPIVFFTYWLLPHKYRWILLLIASYYFYMSWNPKYVFLILLTTIVSYVAAIYVEKLESKKQKKLVLIGALVVCLGVLFIFKYFNFISESVVSFLSLFSLKMHPVVLSLVLPVGISFYTFQTLSYVIDVYRGETKAERHFGIYATFISFFPQLVAGPIERSSNLLPQIKAEHKFNYEQAMHGVMLMLIGFYKKLVIADVVAPLVDAVYANPEAFIGFDLCFAIFFFTIQIYCDFSGYSDIAIGTAKLMGIDLMTNFKSPYFSKSFKEFWSRWHISLSSWFRDYIYIPLGGNRCSKRRADLNLMITFLCSGLWHGANWTFIMWGGIHALLQIIERKLNKFLEPIRNNKAGRWISILIVFAICNFTWVLFRADNFADVAYIFSHFLDGIFNLSDFLRTNLGIWKEDFALIIVTIIFLGIIDFYNLKGDGYAKFCKWNRISRLCFYAVFTLIIIFFSQKGVATEFVYFQF